MWQGIVALTGAPGTVGSASGVDVVDVTRPADLALHLRDTEGPVVVASHPAHAHATRVACTVLAGDQPGRHVAQVAFSQAPLAAVLAMSGALQLAQDAGHGAAIWRDVSDATWSAAVVQGVSRLPSPNPSLRQHLRSLLPGGRYVVRLHPDPEVLPVKRLAAALEPLGRGQVHVRSTKVGSQDRLLDQLGATLAPRSVDQVEVPGSWDVLFGRQEEFQLALVPTDIHRHLRPRGTPCRSCGLSTIDPVCAFCRLRVSVAQGAGALDRSLPTDTDTAPSAVAMAAAGVPSTGRTT